MVYFILILKFQPFVLRMMVVAGTMFNFLYVVLDYKFRLQKKRTTKKWIKNDVY